jgi:5-oxoprolinase (ATP-hydrolysing)
MANQHWQFWIDRGGTFTDVVALSPQSRILTGKFLSENPACYDDAALYAIEQFLADSEHKTIQSIRMGTTVGTNALLERKGSSTALLVTSGFKDSLAIGYQNRPDIFALHIIKPQPLYTCAVEIKERVNAQGQVLQALDEADTVIQLKQLFAQGVQSLAVVLMHSWIYPEHELQIAHWARQIGFQQISLSHQVSPFMKLVRRGDTTVLDAYLSPVLRRYVDRFNQGVRNLSDSAQILFMQSNGGLIEGEHFQGKDCILSGPAGGIIGAVHTARQTGFDKIIAFDMGGTSTDVAHYAGEFERINETEIAGIRLQTPMLNIHTVAAGGGSILQFDGLRCRVGPESAGANPGPACYRKGGPLTVTDANVLLGKLPLFPAVVGERGNELLDRDRVAILFTELAEHINRQTGECKTALEIAEGFIDIAVENMAAAIKRISVQKGYDVSSYALCCYGAAGGQHACKVADRLEMQTIILHPLAGVLSAYGMGVACIRVLKEQSMEKNWSEMQEPDFEAAFYQLDQMAQDELQLQSSSGHSVTRVAKVMVRYIGTDTALEVHFATKEQMAEAFQQQYQQQFGFCYTDKPLICEGLSVELIVDSHIAHSVSIPAHEKMSQEPVMHTDLFSAGQLWQAPVWQRSQLVAQQVVKGPAVILEPTSTLVIEPGWRVRLDADHSLILTRYQDLMTRQVECTERPDPILLEIFNRQFMSIAEQMGFVLQQTAHSVNIKERLDFSCAVFDAEGRLIANAPHIPVHLGSMGESVTALMRAPHIHLAADEVYLINSPFSGGTHLPDITVIMPVFSDSDATVLFFLAARGHHADVGGKTPGSMPSDSDHIDQEGVISDGMVIVKNGKFQHQVVMEWLQSSSNPARNPAQNIADLQAQIAACHKGKVELFKLIRDYSLNTVLRYMTFVRDHAAESVRRRLRQLHSGGFKNTLDQGSVIQIQVSVDPVLAEAVIDFSGTSIQQTHNFNAPAAVCKAAVMYVFRILVADDIPLNSGCMEPLKIILPKGCFLHPVYPAAVVAGNVETSQQIVDTLLAALGQLAASQGTMNNVSFGHDRVQYYETICGGSGAGEGFDGCDAVQTHMTNSRITDPEVLEWRFPVLLEEFSIRTDSGGRGRWRGGNGVVRRIQFLENMTVSILSGRRLTQPLGLCKGQPGRSGINRWIRVQGEHVILPSCVTIEVEKGDKLEIMTPGGGGFGDV